VHRASENIEIANFLHWYIFCQQLVEADLKDVKGRARCYERAQRRLIKTLELTEKGRVRLSFFFHFDLLARPYLPAIKCLIDVACV
jgi:hypothetical protein